MQGGSDCWTHSRGNILIADCDENLNWYTGKGCRKKKNKPKHGSKNAQRRTQRAPWHNRLEACQVVAFLAFISGCGVAEGGRARLAEQSRAGGILQGEGRREREGVNKLNTGEKGKREREGGRGRQNNGGSPLPYPLSPPLHSGLEGGAQMWTHTEKTRDREQYGSHVCLIGAGMERSVL